MYVCIGNHSACRCSERQLEYLDPAIFIGQQQVALPRNRAHVGRRARHLAAALAHHHVTQQLAVGRQHVHAPVHRVGDVDAVVLVERHAARLAQLLWFRAERAVLEFESSSFVVSL